MKTKLHHAALVVIGLAGLFSVSAKAQGPPPPPLPFPPPLQYWALNGNLNAFTTSKLGATSSGIPLNLYSGGFQRMILDGLTGNVGISTTFPFPGGQPNNLLDVNGGDIDVNTATNGYKIGDKFVLWHKGNTANIFVGVGAGLNNTATNATLVGNNAGLNNTGANTTFVGNNAGMNNKGSNNIFIGLNSGQVSTGGANTFVGVSTGWVNTTARGCSFFGYNAGYSNTIGSWNTFMGFKSGFSNTQGSANSFYGKEAGLSNVSGRANVYIGDHTGWLNTIGQYNTIVGTRAGENATGSENTFMGTLTGNLNTGNQNVFLGRSAGTNHTAGDLNTYVGYGAQNTTTYNTLHNSAAIGANAIVTDNFKMILGDNDIDVGIGLSNDAAPPANKLEINYSVAGNNTVPNPGLGTGFSGLRFRDLTSSSIPYTVNPGVGVLSVDPSGDVIYVPASTGGGTGTLTNANNGTSLDPSDPTTVQFGNNVGLTSAQLLNNREVPMNNKNIFFTDPSSPAFTDNRIGIGTTSPLAKFAVQNITTNIAGLFESTTNTFSYNIGVAANANSSPFNVAGQFFAESPTLTNENHGMEGRSFNGMINYGAICIAHNNTYTPATLNYGTWTQAYGSTTNYGIYSTAGQGSDPAETSYAIYGVAGAGTSYAGWFQGDVNVNGALTVFGAPVLTSDQMFKTNVDSINDALSIIKQLKPRTFNFDTANAYGIKFPNQKQYGLIAQDVETILPELVVNSIKPVTLDSAGNIVHPAVAYKSLNYNAFFAILMKGIQEQQKSIDSLKTKTSNQDSINSSMQHQITQLMGMITDCCNNNGNHNGNHSMSNINIDLKDGQTIVLEQNVPNPFAEQTVINYFLPDDVNKAQMLFYNAGGKLIQSVELTQKGKGSLTVFASDLSNGIYTYTLVVDGKIIETKKMVKQ